MEVSIGQVTKNQSIYEGGIEEKSGAKKKLKSLLQGDNVNIISTGDFQKLLAEMQEKVNEKSKELALNSLSNALGRLNGIALGIADGQKAALTELQMETEKLEALVKAYTKTDEELKKELEYKKTLEKQKAGIEVLIAQMDTLIEKELSSDVVDEKKVKELKETKERYQNSLATINKQIAGAQKVIDTQVGELEANLKQQKEVQAKIASIIGKLDSSGLTILLQALRLTAGQVMSQANGMLQEDVKEKESWQTVVFDIVTEALNEKMEDMRDEIISKQTREV